MRKPWGSLDKDRVRQLHSQGLTDNQIAAEMGESPRGIRSARIRMKLIRNNLKFTCVCGKTFDSCNIRAKYCPDCKDSFRAIYWQRRYTWDSLRELAKVNPQRAREVIEEMKREDPETFQGMGDLSKIFINESLSA